MPYTRKSRSELEQMTLDDLTLRKRVLEILFRAVREAHSAQPAGTQPPPEWAALVGEINDCTIVMLEKIVAA
jgi:hypothetical protein